MKRMILLTSMLLTIVTTHAQVYTQFYYDPKHFASFTENQVFRLANEIILKNQTESIRKNIENINTNMTKWVFVKDMVYRYLTEVNEVLKDGRQLKYIISLVDDIASECSGILADVEKAPQYTVFALNSVGTIRLQSVNIFLEISRLVNKGGAEVMMTNSTRDELLTDITLRLKIMRGALFRIRSSIKWAKLNGFWTTLNPFKTWVNQDRNVINRIIRDYKQLTR
ncbi:hypothetical protein [Sphingobacterium siyangense]|uniref:hypothetical protein n=1 Tax=Sphingobacterium siyangense TaxID=459529 RepID=UPI0028964088|nr:hypothetical protein [Sphingobacterium siyangense]